MTRSAAYRFRTLMGSTLLLMLVASPAFAQSPEAEESLYDRLGGLQAIALVVSDFMDVFIADPLIMANPAVRERKTVDTAPYIKFQVTAMTCEATGGPCQYTGLNMRDAHDGLGVTPEEWERMVELFAQTLERHGVPERETQELFAVLGPTRDDIVH
jgi:hemoglobin